MHIWNIKKNSVKLYIMWGASKFTQYGLIYRHSSILEVEYEYTFLLKINV